MLKLSHMFRLPLLLLFALLQCVAPLAHAHVNGQNADRHVHLAYLDHLDLSAHTSNLPHLTVEADHSSVVTLPPESRASDLKVAQAAAETHESLLPLRSYVVQQFAALPRQTLPFLPYQHPCSQAPPA